MPSEREELNSQETCVAETSREDTGLGFCLLHFAFWCFVLWYWEFNLRCLSSNSLTAETLRLGSNFRPSYLSLAECQADRYAPLNPTRSEFSGMFTELRWKGDRQDFNSLHGVPNPQVYKYSVCD